MLLSMKLGYEEFDLSGVVRYPLASRPSKVRREHFAAPHVPGATVAEFVARLPKLLAAGEFAAVVEAMAAAHAAGAPIVWGLGAHVIKAGLSPVLIDLMERGLVSAVALNGAGVIHDVEIALVGATSEDVDAALGPGRFGMAEETATGINDAVASGVARGDGLAQSVATWLAAQAPPHAEVSLLCAAARLEVPVTAHVAVGTDIVHMHPDASGRRHRRGEPARLPLPGLVGRPPRWRGLPQLRIGGRVARGIPEGGRGGPQPGARPDRA